MLAFVVLSAFLASATAESAPYSYQVTYSNFTSAPTANQIADLRQRHALLAGVPTSQVEVVITNWTATINTSDTSNTTQTNTTTSNTTDTNTTSTNTTSSNSSTTNMTNVTRYNATVIIRDTNVTKANMSNLLTNMTSAVNFTDAYPGVIMGTLSAADTVPTAPEPLPVAPVPPPVATYSYKIVYSNFSSSLTASQIMDFRERHASLAQVPIANVEVTVSNWTYTVNVSNSNTTTSNTSTSNTTTNTSSTNVTSNTTDTTNTTSSNTTVNTTLSNMTDMSNTTSNTTISNTTMNTTDTNTTNSTTSNTTSNTSNTNTTTNTTTWTLVTVTRYNATVIITNSTLALANISSNVTTLVNSTYFTGVYAGVFVTSVDTYTNESAPAPQRANNTEPVPAPKETTYSYQVKYTNFTTMPNTAQVEDLRQRHATLAEVPISNVEVVIGTYSTRAPQYSATVNIIGTTLSQSTISSRVSTMTSSPAFMAAYPGVQAQPVVAYNAPADESSLSGSAIAAIIVCSIIFAVLVIGGIGLLVYMFVIRPRRAKVMVPAQKGHHHHHHADGSIHHDHEEMKGANKA